MIPRVSDSLFLNWGVLLLKAADMAAFKHFKIQESLRNGILSKKRDTHPNTPNPYIIRIIAATIPNP